MIIVGEKLNGIIPTVRAAIEAKDEEFIRDLARRQHANKADYLDVCTAVEENDEEVMKWMIDLIQDEIPDVRFSLDSPNPVTIVNAIKYCKNPGIINSVSLEGTKIETIIPAIADTEWNIIGLLIGRNGMPESAQDRLDNFHELYGELKKYGIADDRIYIDPLVLSVATLPNAFLDFVYTSQKIKEEYPDLHIISGLSNISFGIPSRKSLNLSFLIGAMHFGMDAAILDPLSKDMQGGVYATEALMGKDPYCKKYLKAYRKDLFGVKKVPPQAGK